MSVAEVYELPVARRPLEPPRPPRASEHMTFFGWMTAMRTSALGAWGQRAYEEDIIRGRLFGRSSFTVNTPDPWPRCVDRRGAGLETPAPNARAGLHAARGDDARSAHDRGDG